MRAFRTLWIDSMKMLLRNRVLIVTSLGIGLISIFVFGWLFGGNGNFTLHLGVVNEDGSALSAQMVQQLKQNTSLNVTTGSDTGEMAALRAGNRDAVLIMQPGFGAELQHGGAPLQVFYAQSNPTTLTATRGAVESIVDNINANVAGRTPPITIAEQAVSVHNLRQIDFITPGMLGMMLMWTNLAVGTILVTWRQQGIMKRLAATPLPPGTLIATQMLARLGLSLAQAAVLIGVAMTVFHVQIVGNWLVLGLVVALGALAMLGLGGVVGSFARTPDESQSIFFLISFPMMFLGGSYFSTTDAPSFLQPVVNFLPLTHLNDALRQIINNGASLASVQTDLLILAAWMIATLLLSARAFRWS